MDAHFEFWDLHVHLTTLTIFLYFDHPDIGRTRAFATRNLGRPYV